MRLWAEDATFTLRSTRIDNVLYPVEESRGYQARGDLWSPGNFRFTLRAGQPATLVASTEPFETMNVLEPTQALDAERRRRQRLLAQAPPEARDGVAAELVLAADQFIITPAGRTDEAARAHAYGDEVRTVIAGYHWFTDWGRDTMISLEGLTLVTGRHVEAGYILRTFAHYVRDGLIPNMFPEREKEGLYHTADATLWFFHAVQRYIDYTDDRLTLSLLYPTLKHIIDYHVRGTRFGIRVDERDGLLTQGADGYQLTWMDAKVDDWVVTPRRGKAVEINALWFNALKLMERWAGEHGDSSAEYRELAERARRSFNDRFWHPGQDCLYDIVDVDGFPGLVDPKCRPNQVLAIALPHPVLARERWTSVMQRRARSPADAGRAALARARRRRLQVALLRRPARARRRLPPGHGLGLARRPVRRRMAQGLPRRSGGRAPHARRIHPASRRRRDRIDQRSVRRGRAVHAARLYRAGVERRGSAACVGETFTAGARGSGRTVCECGSPVVNLPVMSSVVAGTSLAIVLGQEGTMAKDKIQSGILGDINPKPGTEEPVESGKSAGSHEDPSSMVGGSQHDRTEHSGSRDVTEGVTGGLGTETGGTRNYRQGTGHTGGDIGNRPE